MVHLHGVDVMFDLVAQYPAQALNWHDRETSPALGEGMKRFRGAVSGGLEHWQDVLRGEPDLMVVDVRSPAEYGRHHIAGAVNIPLGELRGRLAELGRRYPEAMLICAHIGGVRERVAAAGFGGGATVFATENIACSPDATMDWLLNVWGDSDHMMPMVESRYTHIGAAAYTDSDGLTYYVLHAAYSAGTGVVNPPAPVDNPADTVVDTSQLVEPVFTVTPQDDGSIVHVVKYGHTLFSIATWYNVSMEEIIALNNLGSSSLLDGQKLIIRLAPTATITPTRTSTPQQPTRTPSLTPTPTAFQPLATITPTPKPEFLEELPRIDRQWLGMGLLVLSAVGLFAVTWFGFLKARRK